MTKPSALHESTSTTHDQSRALPVLILVALVLAGVPARVNSQQNPPDVRFEMRLASLTAAEGLQEYPVDVADHTVFVSPRPELTNADVERAWYEQQDGNHRVGLLLTEDGALKLARLTKKHRGELIALIVNERVVSAPRIAGEISGGRALIQGKFTEVEARALAAGLSAAREPAGG